MTKKMRSVDGRVLFFCWLDGCFCWQVNGPPDKLFFLRRLQHISSSCLSNTSRESSICEMRYASISNSTELLLIRAARQSQISYFALATYTLPVVMMRDDIAAMKCLLVKWKLRKSRFQLVRKKWACWYRMPKQARVDKTVSMSCVVRLFDSLLTTRLAYCCKIN